MNVDNEYSLELLVHASEVKEIVESLVKKSECLNMF